jgi:hypothetical protein
MWHSYFQNKKNILRIITAANKNQKAFFFKFKAIKKTIKKKKR